MATAYWEKRAAFKQAAYDRADAKVMQKVHNTYDRAFEQVDRDIDRIISTFTRKTGLTPKEAMDMLNGKISVADITGDLTPGALEVLGRTGGYQARITRLDAIKDSFRTALTQASEAELKAVTNHLEIVGETAYKMTSYDIQKSIGYGAAMKGIPSRSLDRILKYKWSGESFSKRVWKNRDAMVSMLDNAMKEMVGIGKLTDATYQDIKGLVDITKWAGKAKSKFKDVNQFAKYAANRLIRTESSYVSNQTTAVAYGEYGIEQYEFLSTLDRRTSSVCQNHDGLINPDTGGPYMMSEIEVGKNYPPLHPFCRSATAPAIEGRSRDKLKRRARRPDGKTELIPRDMNYKEWDQWQQDGAPPDIQKWREGKTKPVGVNGKNILESKINPGDYAHSTEDVRKVIKQQGFDGLPTVISQTEYDELIKNGSPYMRRGYGAPNPDVLNEYKRQLREGDFYVDCSGGHMNGKGMYTAAAMDPSLRSIVKDADQLADRFSYSGRSPMVEKMTLQPNTRLIDYVKVNDEYSESIVKNIDKLTLPDESMRDPFSKYIKLGIGNPSSEVLTEMDDIKNEWIERYSEVKRISQLEAKDMWDEVDEGVIEIDQGVKAALMGYDGILVNREERCSFVVVLNRTKLIIVD